MAKKPPPPSTPPPPLPPGTLQRLPSLPSIEEPKTLSEAELNELRARALNIINTHTHEEATRIFLAGSRQVDLNPPAKLENKPTRKTVCGKRSRYPK